MNARPLAILCLAAVCFVGLVACRRAPSPSARAAKPAGSTHEAASMEDAMSPAPTPDLAWDAKGADLVLLYRPSLRERADRELAGSGAAGIPALVAAIERLRPLAAAHPGTSRRGSHPWETGTVYEPSDDELLLSLAGDRVWRTTQIAPIGVVADVRAAHPDLPEAFEYPHIEITRVEVAGTGPRYVAAPPQTRRVVLGKAPR